MINNIGYIYSIQYTFCFYTRMDGWTDGWMDGWMDASAKLQTN